MRFRRLREDVSTGAALLASRRLNNGDWDYWLVIELINMHEACGLDAPHKYMATINAVSPEAAGEEKVRRAIECLDLDGDNDLTNVEGLQEYGVYAPLWSDSGDNLGKLRSKARREAEGIEVLFGFFMDRPWNRLGHTGWDLIKGDLSLEAAQRNREQWERLVESK